MDAFLHNLLKFIKNNRTLKACQIPNEDSDATVRVT